MQLKGSVANKTTRLTDAVGWTRREMGSGISSQVNDDGGGHLRQTQEAERKLANKFPKFRDIKFKRTDYGSKDSGIRGGEVKSNFQGGVYTTVYSYYHWKNYKNKYNNLIPANNTK